MQFNNYVFEICTTKRKNVPTMFVKVKSPEGKLKVMTMKDAELFFNSLVEKTQAKNTVLTDKDTFSKIPQELRSIVKSDYPKVNLIRVLDYSEYGENDTWCMTYKFLCENKLGQKSILYYEKNDMENYWHFVKKEYL